MIPALMGIALGAWHGNNFSEKHSDVRRPLRTGTYALAWVSPPSFELGHLCNQAHCPAGIVGDRRLSPRVDRLGPMQPIAQAQDGGRLFLPVVPSGVASADEPWSARPSPTDTNSFRGYTGLSITGSLRPPDGLKQNKAACVISKQPKEVL